MKRTLLGLLVGLIGYSILAVLHFPARAQSNSACVEYSAHLEIAKAHPMVQATHELAAGELQKTIAFVGADTSSPITVGYLALMNDNSVRFIFGADGVVCKMVTIPANAVPALIDTLTGRPA